MTSSDRLRSRIGAIGSGTSPQVPLPALLAGPSTAKPVSTGRAGRRGGKKLMNDPDKLVRESLSAFGVANSGLVRVDVERRLVLRVQAPVAGKVAVISGGGSGHEPLDIGFVGEGMLDGACVGEIFTSPSSDQVLAATLAVDGGSGVLYVVKNYAGDAMNFAMAADDARAAGVEVELVFTNDDVALGGVPTAQGRRGTGVTPLVQKVAGAAAEAGYSLDGVAEVARRANERGRTLGIALESCVNPNLGKPTFELGVDEIEFGVGIHGEPGRRREKLASAAEMVEQMVQDLLADLRPAHGSELLAFVNGFGATPLIELYVVYGELATRISGRGLRITRNLVGNFVTSLNMAGMSITLLALDEELRRLWDAPVRTTALRRG